MVRGKMKADHNDAVNEKTDLPAAVEQLLSTGEINRRSALKLMGASLAMAMGIVGFLLKFVITYLLENAGI